MTEKILILLTCILFSVAFAIRNAYQRKEVGAYNKYANDRWHLWEVVIKTCFALAIAILTATWFHRCFALLMVASIDFFLFPLVLNLRTAKHWAYLSDRGIDKYLRKLPNVLLLMIKLILILVSVTYYLTNPYK